MAEEKSGRRKVECGKGRCEMGNAMVSRRGAGARRGEGFSRRHGEHGGGEDGPVKYAAHFTGERGLMADGGGKKRKDKSGMWRVRALRAW
jgi:hypothetical protein